MTIRPRVRIIGTYHSIQLFDPWHTLEAAICKHRDVDVLFDEWTLTRHATLWTAVQMAAYHLGLEYHELESLESRKEIESEEILGEFGVFDEREKHWIDVIEANHKGRNFLVVCGGAHTISIGLKLKALGYSVSSEFVESPDLEALDRCYQRVLPTLKGTSTF